jgi:uncharacterized protein YuzE
MMKVSYGPGVDVLRIPLIDQPIEESDEEKPGIILDYDGAGNLVGLEVLEGATESVADGLDQPKTRGLNASRFQ